jgi:hypothetical protein
MDKSDCYIGLKDLTITQYQVEIASLLENGIKEEFI